MKKEQRLAGVELGVRQFSASWGAVREASPRLLIRGIGSVPAQGYEKEGLSDPIECSDAIARLMRQLERNSPERITRVSVAFPSGFLRCINASASVPVSDPAAGISRQDVERVTSACRTMSVDYERQILHAFERGFTVDGQAGIRNPIGLTGRQLTVDLHLVTAAASTLQNLTKTFARAGLEVSEFVMPGLAVAGSVLSELDQDLGVTVVRIGEFQTDAVLFDDGSVRETFLIPGGSEDLIEILSRSFKVPRVSAEFLLEQVRSLEENPVPAGSAGELLPASGNSEWASVPLRAGAGASAKGFPQGEVVHLVRSRIKDFLTRIHRRLMTSPFFLDSASGMVMVGPLTRLEGFLEMAEGIFNTPVRLGTVKEVELSPEVTIRAQDLTAVGLMRHRSRLLAPSARAGATTPWLRPLEKIQRLFQEYF